MQAGLAVWKQQSHRVILASMTIALVITFLFALSIGQVHIPVTEIITILLHKVSLASGADIDTVHETVLLSIRLPRLLMTILIGASLGLSGAALQGLFRNPLVEPGLIGVSSGAALGVVTLIVFGTSVGLVSGGRSMSVLMPLSAFAGGLLATTLVQQIGVQVNKANVAVLILAGVAINALAGSLMGLVVFHADENQLRMFTFWTLGDMGGATWQQLLVAAPLLMFSCVGLMRYQHALNAIALGETEAFHMGVDVQRVKNRIVFFAALAVGTSVSLAGAIGFVGLVVPHLVRVAFHSDNRLVLPASVLCGPLLLILADMASRMVVAPAELPIGVVTALIGAPFFIYLLIHSRRKNELAI